MSNSDQAGMLLSLLESARDGTARRLVQDYHTITDPDLNFITISSLLQVLFLKTGQECGFVEPGTLRALAGCDGIGKRMARACSDAGLRPEFFFEKGPGCSCTSPVLPDEPFREVIQRMDQPDFPAPLTRLPLEELVDVLEKFLGTRMQTGEGCRVNRAGKSSLLYTGTVDVPPWKIIESSVNETIDKITNGTSVGRVLDPACGCGLFLLAAYRKIARSRIMMFIYSQQVQDTLRDPAVTSVFGTDIDPESVSAARLVLLFAFIEESKRPGRRIISAAHIRDVCMSLTTTIRCGNSLIGPDYFSGKPVFPFNTDEYRKVNPFCWQDSFPEVLAGGGFDAVISAPPPYRPFAVPAREEYFQTHYDTYAASAGLYGYFIEKGLGLLRPGGTLCVLLPATFLRPRYARPLRRLLLTRQIERIANTGRTRLLPEGEVMIYRLVLRNEPPSHPFIVSPVGLDPGEIVSGRHDFTLDQCSLDAGGWTLEDTRTKRILEKIQKTGTLLDHYLLGEIHAGAHHVRNNPLVVDQETRNRLTENVWRARRFFLPLLRPSDIRRYVPEKPSRYIISAENSRPVRKCRALSEYLEQATVVPETEPGCELAGADFHRPDDPERTPLTKQRPPKIIFSLYQHIPAFSFDSKGSYAVASSLLFIARDDPYLVAILNSSLGRFIITHICPLTDRGYHITPAGLGKFPVMIPDFDKLADRTRHDKIVSLVMHILELNRYLPQAKTDQERRLVQQEIELTDVRINALIYDLYGLTSEEITVIEGCISS